MKPAENGIICRRDKNMGRVHGCGLQSRGLYFLQTVCHRIEQKGERLLIHGVMCSQVIRQTMHAEGFHLFPQEYNILCVQGRCGQAQECLVHTVLPLMCLQDFGTFLFEFADFGIHKNTEQKIADDTRDFIESLMGIFQLNAMSRSRRRMS